MSFESRYAKLNDEQKQAVDLTEGPVMVIAGPGSGKTELLSLRVGNILRKSDVLPRNILCLTFTDAAAKNMRERLAGLIGVDAYKVAIHTFHTFALSIMHQFRDDFYDARQMETADDIVKIDTIGKILEALPFSDALSKKKHDGTFVYLSSVLDRIGKLKKAGISPKEYMTILATNRVAYETLEKILIPIFSERMSKKVIEKIPNALIAIDAADMPALMMSHTTIQEYKSVIICSLTRAYQDSVEQDSTKPMTAWKDEWFKKDSDTKELHLKDLHQYERNNTLATVYRTYGDTMRESGYIDFDDMIVDVIEAIEEKPGLLETLQEQYQYILVDEFQDTNDAQMRIIHLLTDHIANEGMPNVMVVGDDDQAIYKFQGAELNNILHFRRLYPATTFIALTKNYRSTADIVDFASRIIDQGEDRLVDRIEALEKKLEAANAALGEGTIIAHTFDTATHEYSYIAEEIAQKIRAGVAPTDIAVIAKNHRQLETLALYFSEKHIPIKYERQRNVLEEPHIFQLIVLIRLIHSLQKEHIYYQNELMPTILSFPFWNLERSVVWQISIEANALKTEEHHGRWIDAMMRSANPKLSVIATWLLDMAALSASTNFDTMLDHLIGPAEEKEVYTSPFRRYYFHPNAYAEDSRTYLSFLSSVRTFIDTVRGYAKKREYAHLADVVECVETYESHGLSITDTSPYMSGADAVTLMSAHKSKGLEFDTVFVINCQDDIWAKAQGMDMIAFPKNLPIDPAGETMDDHLRLFFVALTRAKRHLYVTSFIKKDNGKDSLRVPFLDQTMIESFAGRVACEHRRGSSEQTITALETSLFHPVGPIAYDEVGVLLPLVERYVMSVTHLNNFLDVTKGGPHYFFENNLLRFPQAKSESMSYGTAMHATLEGLYAVFKKTGVIPKLPKVQEIYEEALKKNRLEKQAYEKYLKKGNDVWSIYLAAAADRIDVSHWIETDFRQQQVQIGSAHITGKIDKIVPHIEERVLDVYDFKTGSHKRSWDGHDEIKKIQLHGYKRQLIFYKLLVEHSRDFSKYRVNTGYLEFLDPTNDGQIVLLSYQIQEEDVERMKQLIEAVQKKITTLDFPDISKYETSLAGIIAFENDLIDGNV